MNITWIEFTLENCEAIRFDGKYIGDIGIGKIKEKFGRIACNAVDHWKECSEFWIEIHKDADEKYRPFNCGEEIGKFRRLSCDNDITNITIGYLTGTLEYRVRWTGGYDYENLSQDSTIGDQGNLYLKIGKKKLEKYFYPRGIDDKGWPWINEMEEK